MAAKMDMRWLIVVRDRKTNQVVTTMESPEFMKLTKAPRDMFVDDAVKRFNAMQTENVAEVETSVRPRGKHGEWRRL